MVGHWCFIMLAYLLNRCRNDHWNHRVHGHPPAQFLPAILVAALLLHAARGYSQTAADSSSQLTLTQFRSLVAARLSETSRATSKSRDKQPPPDLHPAEEVFARLLILQARGSAVHQSVDRLAGWGKAIRLRFQTQNAPELDVDVARFEEARMVAESARIEAEKKRAVEQANSLLGRPAAAPLVALLPLSRAEDPNGVDKQQKDVLAEGEELVTKMYRSYQFGGITVTALMEYEKVLYELELEYREQWARDAMKPATE